MWNKRLRYGLFHDQNPPICIGREDKHLARAKVIEWTWTRVWSAEEFYWYGLVSSLVQTLRTEILQNGAKVSRLIKKNFSGKKKNKPTPSSFQRGDKWERKDRKKQIRKGSWPVECWGRSAAAGSRGYSTDEDRQMIDEELGNAAVIFVNFQAYWLLGGHYHLRLLFPQDHTELMSSRGLVMMVFLLQPCVPNSVWINTIIFLKFKKMTTKNLSGEKLINCWRTTRVTKVEWGRFEMLVLKLSSECMHRALLGIAGLQ